MNWLNNLKNLLLKLLDLDFTYPRVKSALNDYVYKKGYVSQSFFASKDLQPIDIIMPTFNRPRETRRCINNLYEKISIPFRLIIVDNNSTKEMKNLLKRMASSKSNIELILLEDNLGGAGSRMKGLQLAKSEFVAFIDNDIYVMHRYLEHLLNTIKSSDYIAVQSKVVQPNGLVQVNRPYYEIDNGWAIFYDKDIGKRFNDKYTEIQEEINWLPAGATMWRREIFNKYSFDESMGTLYEDNDFAFRLNKDGIKFTNCPSAVCLHYSSDFAPDNTNNNQYTKERFSKDKTLNSAKIFFKKHGLYFSYGKPEHYVKHIGFGSVTEYIQFLKK